MTDALPEASLAVTVQDLLITSRQQQILQKICDGKSIRDIAFDLYISENTVKYHLKVLFKQLHVHNRAMLVRLAIMRGWVS